MSFILDALKKSESQRQRQDGPGFATVRSGERTQPIPLWVPLLGGLLLINAIVLGVLFWPRGEPVAVASAAPLPAPRSTQTDTSASESKAPRIVRSLAREASASASGAGAQDPMIDPIMDATASSTALPGAAGSVTVIPEDEMDAYLGLSDPPAAQSNAGTVTHVIGNPSADEPLLRDLTDLRLNGEINLPDLHLDVHVYAPDQAGRFVFINMKKYVEGDTLREGPQLQEITTGGAVLVYNGRRFAIRPD